MRLFFDLNVVLDVLARREPWFEQSAAVLSLVDKTAVEGYVAAHSVTTLNYLLSKYHGRERTPAALIDLLGFVRAVNVDHDRLLEALALGWSDFEDAVQAVCALGISADYLITRDPKGFPALSIPVVTPSELLAILPE
ncbi:MAG: PIN domain-containing protein [Gemmatimonadaceae bacterium]